MVTLILLPPNPHISHVKLHLKLLHFLGLPCSLILVFIPVLNAFCLWVEIQDTVKSSALGNFSKPSPLSLGLHLGPSSEKSWCFQSIVLFFFFFNTYIALGENSAWCSFKEIREDCLSAKVISPSGSYCLNFYN